MKRHIVWIAASLLALGMDASAVGPADGPDAEAVDFQTADGERIFADYYAPGAEYGPAPMVILLHMYGQDRKTWEPLVGPLHQAGFAVLAVDLRGHGESATPSTEKRVADRDGTLFKSMYQDVRAAYDFLATHDNVDRARVALVGASVGCSIALDYAVEDKSVDAVACLSPGLNYLGLDSKRSMRQIAGRKLLLLATEDERAAVDELAALGSGVTTHIYDGKAHGTRMFGAVPDVERRVVEFLKEGVGKRSQQTVYGTINSGIYHPAESGWIARIIPTNLRYYSSPEEAESRGLRRTKSLKPDERREEGEPRRP